MDIPHREILAPTAALGDLRGVDDTARTISAYGKAPGLERLGDFRQLDRLWLSGLSTKQAPGLPSLRVLRSLVIHDFRCPDPMVLPDLPALEYFAICGSPKLRALDGLARFRGLKTLLLFDNCNYGDLSPLENLGELETLCLEGGFSKMLRVQTLEPLSRLDKLRQLRLASIRVESGGLQPLRALHGLESVFIAKTFPDAELRMLAKALPHARGEFLDSFRGARAN